MPKAKFTIWIPYLAYIMAALRHVHARSHRVPSKRVLAVMEVSRDGKHRCRARLKHGGGG
jgi:hypothetical protein